MARVGSQPFDKLDIPIVMKVVRVQPRGGDKLLVSAGIVVVGCVEGLVQVANEVQQELQRHEVLGRDGGRIAELGRELIDLVNHAGLRRAFRCRNPWRERRMAETSRDKIRLRQFDIHKVPPPCRYRILVPLRSLSRYLSAHVASLAMSCAVKVAVSAARSVATLKAHSRVEVLLGDERDDLVTFVAPSERGKRVSQCDG